MAKKGKKNKKKKSAAAGESNLGAEECSLLKTVTIDQIRALPAAPDHVWMVRISKTGMLKVVDMSNEMFHAAKEARTMLSCRCDTNDSDSVIKIIFNAMVDPSYEADPGDPFATFHHPRRPRFLLIDPSLKASSYAKIKRQVELTGVPVRRYSRRSSVEARIAVVSKVHNCPDSTYMEGFNKGPTAAIVSDILPMRRDEIWKVSWKVGSSCDSRENELGEQVLLVVEDVTRQPITVVGAGRVRVFSMPEAILATMLSPVEFERGGNEPVVGGVPRRPGLLLLAEGMSPALEYIQGALLGSGVEVKVHDASSNLCGNAGCYRVTATEELLDCKCKAVSYCSKDCQRADWAHHKLSCSWYEEKNEA